MSTESTGTLVPGSLDSNQIHINSYPLSPQQRYGLKIEQQVIQELEKRGYEAHVPTNFSQKACDAVVRGLCVEIKGAKRTKRTRVLSSGEVKSYWRYQWSLDQRPEGEFVLILVADTPQKKRFHFIVPGSQIGDRTHIQITSHPLKYQGWLSEYLEKWDVIDYLAGQIYLSNGPMFAEWERAGERVAA